MGSVRFSMTQSGFTLQKDVYKRQVIKNTGQLPMYLIENHHEGIVSREKYNAVQAEMARRKAAKSPSKRASTGLSAYTSRYALSDRLVCGECGTLYRRCTWTRPDGKRVVWRCVSRLDYGKKYCHSSPTLDEVPLQQAIIAADVYKRQKQATAPSSPCRKRRRMKPSAASTISSSIRASPFWSRCWKPSRRSVIADCSGARRCV